MSIEKVLDRWHEQLTQISFFQIFTAMTRILLFVGFTPPSIVKILNRPFTVLPDSNPVGHYFNALYQTGFYYQFLGWSQLIAAVLLIFPRTAHLGALMFLPIILNIAVLTSSVGFKGTWLVTIMMTVAATYLVAWDYDRLKPILFGARNTEPSVLPREFIWVPLFFGVGGAMLRGLAAIIKLGNASNYLTMTGFLIVIGTVFGVGVAAHHRFIRVGKLENNRKIV